MNLPDWVKKPFAKNGSKTGIETAVSNATSPIPLPEIKPLKPGTQLPLEEVLTRYDTVNQGYQIIKSHYEFPVKSGTKMSQDDSRYLSDCFGVLFALMMQESLQKNGTIQQNVVELQFRMGNYMSGFKDSGIKVYNTSSMMY
jgi:hypothetical protein